MSGLLGADTAELDEQMLSRAFFEHVVMRELAELNRGFRVVVGRRGAGKSALRMRLSTTKLPLNLQHADFEFHSLLQALKSIGVSNYQNSKTVTRVAWRTQLTLVAAQQLAEHFKNKNSDAAGAVTKILTDAPELKDRVGLDGVLAMLQRTIATSTGLTEFDTPALITKKFSLKLLEQCVRELAETAKREVRFTFDSLDEGWLGDPVSTGVIGGLIAAISDVIEKTPEIEVVVFLRDSMLRSLASHDPDYARNIEGNTIRLEWTKEGLFSLITSRLRVALEITEAKPSKVWNRFASYDLEDLAGFEKCLTHTLFRPRDLIQLLNEAWRIARSHEHTRISLSDIEQADFKWSRTRLNDLISEYSDVFPGLKDIIDLFENQSDCDSYESICARLTHFMQLPTTAASITAGFLVDGRTAFSALYSIGLVGLLRGNQASFCYDGSPHRVEEIAGDAQVVVHPCYWAALRLKRTISTAGLDVDDGYDVAATERAKKKVNSDVRIRLLGRRAEEIADIAVGAPHALRFHNWVLGATRVLLSAQLNPVTVKKLGDAQSVIVGTIQSASGVFRAIYQRNGASELPILALNETESSKDSLHAFADAVAASGLGKLGIVTRRGESDEPTEDERKIIKKIARAKGIFLLILNATTLERSLRKQQDAQSKGWLLDRLHRAVTRHENSYWRT